MAGKKFGPFNQAMGSVQLLWKYSVKLWTYTADNNILCLNTVFHSCSFLTFDRLNLVLAGMRTTFRTNFIGKWREFLIKPHTFSFQATTLQFRPPPFTEPLPFFLCGAPRRKSRKVVTISQVFQNCVIVMVYQWYNFRPMSKRELSQLMPLNKCFY